MAWVQAVERGATEAEVKETVQKGSRQPAKLGREMCRYNFAFGRKWQGRQANEVVVITVYTFYF